MPHHPEACSRPAFTLIEALVSCGVVALLMAILMPTLSSARQQARSTMCLSNLRQLALQTQIYLETNRDRYPVAYWTEVRGEIIYDYAWDFTTLKEVGPGGDVLNVTAGLLWKRKMVGEIQQCPAFKGRANWLEDPFTGYNYNTSYIGHGQWESIPEPASRSHVSSPASTALFGDGQFSAGANKFMRAPWPNPGDVSFFGRQAGTQGFRHRGRTNAAYCDHHADSRHKRYTETSAIEQAGIAPGTGFLSADNHAYALDYQAELLQH